MVLDLKVGAHLWAKSGRKPVVTSAHKWAPSLYPKAFIDWCRVMCGVLALDRLPDTTPVAHVSPSKRAELSIS